jgi:hypothetical protein
VIWGSISNGELGFAVMAHGIGDKVLRLFKTIFDVLLSFYGRSGLRLAKDEITTRIGWFLHEYRKTLDNMTPEEFMEHLVGLSEEYSCYVQFPCTKRAIVIGARLATDVEGPTT